MSLPASWVTTVGSAGPTMVWSRAPRNRPSITAKRISIFARVDSPRAGSSASDGARAPVSKDSMLISVPFVHCLGVVRRVGVLDTAFGDDRRADVVHRRRD